ncbi:MAG TPA: hypothetical protein VFD50_05875 [Thermoleophilia bacterium]|nr:hypothetical protein [Thermoleophilia bacterium]
MTDAGHKGRVQTRPSQARKVRGPFARGFRQRNPLVLLAAAVLGGLFLLLVQSAALHGDFTVVPEAHFIRIPNDDFVHVSYTLAQLRRNPPKGPVVYIFGGSGAVEMFVSEKALAAAVAAAGGGQVQVISLAAHQQTLAQTLAIIDYMPPGKGVLLVGLAPNRFTSSPAQDIGLLSARQILLRSPLIDKLAPKLYHQGLPFGGVIPGIFDYLGSYMRQRAATGPFWGVGVPYAYHYYPPGKKGASDAAKLRTIKQVLATDKRRYAAHADYNFAMLERIVKLGRERGYKVVFYHEPLDTAIGGPTWAGVLTDYQARAQALAGRYGVPYLHPQAASGVTNTEFADLYHLLESGRLKWQGELARLLAPITRSVTAAPAAGVPTASPSPAAT